MERQVGFLGEGAAGERRPDGGCGSLSVTCPPDAHYEHCACPASCESPRPSCEPLCSPGCVCNPGYLFSNDHCITAASCNCLYNNKYYNVSIQGALLPRGAPPESLCEMRLETPEGHSQWQSPAFCTGFGFAVLGMEPRVPEC